MSASLTAPDRTRLVAILGMLGSNFDGERANAAALATRFIKDRNLTWDSVIIPTGIALYEPPKSNPAYHAPPQPPWKLLALWCLGYDEELTDWEYDFCNDMLSMTRCSPKQCAVIDRIVAKIHLKTGAKP